MTSKARHAHSAPCRHSTYRSIDPFEAGNDQATGLVRSSGPTGDGNGVALPAALSMAGGTMLHAMALAKADRLAAPAPDCADGASLLAAAGGWKRAGSYRAEEASVRVHDVSKPHDLPALVEVSSQGQSFVGALTRMRTRVDVRALSRGISVG
jgi:hypothetical protein